MPLSLVVSSTSRLGLGRQPAPRPPLLATQRLIGLHLAAPQLDSVHRLKTMKVLTAPTDHQVLTNTEITPPVELLKVNGKMTELLHLAEARRLVEMDAAIKAMEG